MGGVRVGAVDDLDDEPYGCRDALTASKVSSGGAALCTSAAQSRRWAPWGRAAKHAWRSTCTRGGCKATAGKSDGGKHPGTGARQVESSRWAYVGQGAPNYRKGSRVRGCGYAS